MQIKLSDHFTYKRLFRFVISPIIMMIFTSIYSIVDGFFVSNFCGLNAFTAVNLIFPVLMICSAIGFMIGSGGSALVSKTMGEGEGELAKQYFSMLTYAIIIIGVALAVSGFFLSDYIAIWLGAEGEVHYYAKLYGQIMFLALPAFMMQNFFQSFFITAEKPKLGLFVSLGAGFMNIVLDALLVGVFNCGLVGAGVATAVSQLVGGVLPLIYFISKNSSALRIVKTKVYAKQFFIAVTNGASEFLTNVSMSVVSIVYNFKLLNALGEKGVSAYGFITYVSFFFVSIFIGYSMGVASPVGYNYGANNKKELKNLFSKSVKIVLIVGITMFILAESLAVPISKLFLGYDEELLNISIEAFRLYSFQFIFVGLNIFGSAFFTALNNGVISGVLSTLRTLVFAILTVMLLPIWFNVLGIWIANPVAEALSFIVTIVILAVYRKKYGY